MKPIYFLLTALLCFLCIGTMPLHAQESLQPITDQNAHLLRQLDPIGMGRIESMMWSPDSRWLAIQTPIGIWLIDSKASNTAPVLLRVLDQPQTFAFNDTSSMIAIAGCRGYIPEYFAMDPGQCEHSETHLYALDNLAKTPQLVIDNGQSNITRLVVGAVPFRNAPLVIAQKDDIVLQISNGKRSWYLEIKYWFHSISGILLSLDAQTLVLWAERTVMALDMETYANLGYRTDMPLPALPQDMQLQNVAFSEDGNTLIGVVSNGIWTWDLTQRDAEPVYEAYFQLPEAFDQNQPLQISPDFSYGFTREDRENYLWTDVQAMVDASATNNNRMMLPDSDLMYQGFSPDSTYVLMGSNPGYRYTEGKGSYLAPGIIKLYETTTGTALLELSSAAMVAKAVISPDESTIAYIDDTYTLHLHDITQDQEIGLISGFFSDSYGVVLSQDGQLIYSSCAIYVPTGNTSSCMPSILHIGDRDFPDVAFRGESISPDGQLLVSRGLEFLDTRTGEIVQEIESESSRIWHLDFNTVGTRLAISGEAPQILTVAHPEQNPVMLDVPSGEYGVPQTTAIAFSPDDRMVATASFDGMARLWDAESGELLASMHSAVKEGFDLSSGDGIAFSPDGSLIAFGSCFLGDGSAANLCLDERIYVYEVAQALQQGELQPDDAHLILYGAHDYTVSLIFSPDGSLIIGSTTTRGWETNAGKDVHIWSANTGELLIVLEAFGATELALSPDGTVLYSNSEDGVVYRWGVTDPD